MNEATLIQLHKNTIYPDAIKLPEFHEADMYSTYYTYNGRRREQERYTELKSLTKDYSTLWLEKEKYEQIIELPNVRYVVSTPNGVWAFNLVELPPFPDNFFRWVTVPQQSTHYHREVDGPVKKMAGFLPKGWGINISRIIGWAPGM